MPLHASRRFTALRMFALAISGLFLAGITGCVAPESTAQRARYLEHHRVVVSSEPLAQSASWDARDETTGLAEVAHSTDRAADWP